MCINTMVLISTLEYIFNISFPLLYWLMPDFRWICTLPTNPTNNFYRSQIDLKDYFFPYLIIEASEKNMHFMPNIEIMIKAIEK